MVKVFVHSFFLAIMFLYLVLSNIFKFLLSELDCDLTHQCPIMLVSMIYALCMCSVHLVINQPSLITEYWECGSCD
jgi:hypothetical protein